MFNGGNPVAIVPNRCAQLGIDHIFKTGIYNTIWWYIFSYKFYTAVRQTGFYGYFDLFAWMQTDTCAAYIAFYSTLSVIQN